MTQLLSAALDVTLGLLALAAASLVIATLAVFWPRQRPLPHVEPYPSYTLVPGVYDWAVECPYLHDGYGLKDGVVYRWHFDSRGHQVFHEPGGAAS